MTLPSPSYTIEQIEDSLYGFINGALPLTSLYWVRFSGYTVQHSPAQADIVRRSQCYIKMEEIKPTIRYTEEGNTSVVQETEFVYSLTLEQKRVNAVTLNLHTQALRLCAFREGYDFFNRVGIIQFKTLKPSIMPKKNESTFFIEILLKFRANIILEDIFTGEQASGAGVTVYDFDDKVYEN